MARPVITIAFTDDPFDQWRAAEVGAVIGFDRRGRPEIQFHKYEQFRRYVELNAKRKEFEERRRAVGQGS